MIVVVPVVESVSAKYQRRPPRASWTVPTVPTTYLAGLAGRVVPGVDQRWKDATIGHRRGRWVEER